MTLRHLSLCLAALLAACPALDGQEALYDELYGRALRLDDALPATKSERMSLLVMSRLANPDGAAALADLARQEAESGDDERAFELYDRAFEASGHDFHTGLILLYLAGYLEDWERVESVKKELLTQRPGDSSVLYRLMEVYRLGGKDSLAIATVRQLTESNHRDARYTFLLAGMLADGGRRDEAEKLLRDYLTDRPGDKTGTQMLIAYLMQSGDREEAYALTGSLYERFPDDPEVVRMWSASLAERGLLERAAEVLRRYAADAGTDADALPDMAQSALRAAPDPTGAGEVFLPLFRELARSHPDDEGYQVLALNHFAAAGDSVAVLREARALVDSGAKARPAYGLLLTRYIDAGDNDAIRDLVQKGLKVYPEDEVFLFYDIVGLLIQNPKGDETVMRKIDHALTVVPDESPIRIELLSAKADLLESAGRWDEARPLYEQAANRGHIGASNNLAYFLTIHGTPEDLPLAEKLAAAVIQKEPENATYLDTYAWVLFKRGAFGLAKLYMKKAIDQTPEDDATYWEHYARILTASGDTAEAREAWRHYLEAGGALQTAETGLKELEASEQTRP